MTSRRRKSAAPAFVRPVAILAGSLVLAELSGIVTSRHAVIPPPVLVSGLIAGGPAVLFALGLVLVYRAARIINFAQGAVAVASGIVFLTLQGIRWPWVACAGAAMLTAVGASLLIDLLLLRRFTSASRLVATVVTIAAGQFVVGISELLPQWKFGVGLDKAQQQQQQGGPQIPNVPAHSPLTTHHLKWGVEVFTGDHLLAIIVTVLVALALIIFFRRSNAGIAIRGAAENSEKASTLGISTGTLSSITWGIAGALIGLFTVISMPLSSTSLFTVGSNVGTGTLLAGLAAGVIGKMEDLPTTVAAALGLSVFTNAVYFSTLNGANVEVVLFVVLAVTLLVQRGTLSRVEAAISGGWAAAEEIRAVPTLLKDHVSVRAARRWVYTVGLVVLIGYPFAMNPSQVFLGATFAIFGIVTISLVVLTGWGGQISLGQFAFVAVGASVGGELSAHGWPFPIAWLAATIAGGLIAVVIGIPALRVRGLYLAVMTLAFAAITADYFLDPTRFSWLSPPKVPRPKLLFINFADDRAFYFLALAALFVAIFVAQGLRQTRTGRVLIAMRDNERGAQALGLSLVRVRLTTFAISGALAAFAGMLYASQVRAVRADGFSISESTQIFLMAVIGGLGSVTGVLTGAVYLGCVQLFIHSTALQLFASGAGVLFILLFFPAGLGGAVFAARDAFLRRIALREKILVPSLLGDLSKIDSDANRAPLGPKPEIGARVRATEEYILESDIADAGVSQRGKGWVYG